MLTFTMALTLLANTPEEHDKALVAVLENPALCKLDNKTEHAVKLLQQMISLAREVGSLELPEGRLEEVVQRSVYEVRYRGID